MAIKRYEVNVVVKGVQGVISQVEYGGTKAVAKEHAIRLLAREKGIDIKLINHAKTTAKLLKPAVALS